MRRPPTVYLMLLATVLLWALNFTVSKYVLTHGFRPLAYSVVRYGVAAFIFSTFTLQRERSLRIGRPHVGLLLVCAGVGIWLNQLSFVYALRFAPASTVALILGATPIFAALIAGAVGLERITRRFAAAAAVSFAGVALVAFGSAGALAADLKGNILSLCAAATWACYAVAIAPLMRTYSPFRISAAVLAVGWVPLVVTGAGQVAKQDFSLSKVTWAAFAFATLGPLVVTNILWFTAIARVGPSRATLVANLQPFVAAVVALVLLSEQLTWLQIVGGLTIGLGIVFARRRPLGSAA